MVFLEKWDCWACRKVQFKVAQSDSLSKALQLCRLFSAFEIPKSHANTGVHAQANYTPA